MTHGKSSILVEGDIISIHCSGEYNEEGTIKGITELKSIIENCQQNKFKLLCDYTDAIGGVPSAFDEVNKCNIWLNSQNIVARALVIKSSVNLAILKKRTPATSSHKLQYFDNKASAIAWLKLQ